MKKIGKNITNLLVKTGVVLGIVAPLALASCKKQDDTPPKLKSIEQYVELDKNGVDILYSAKIANVDRAKLNIKKEGVLISTEEISDVNSIGGNYKKTYSYSTNKDITKGDYEFTIASENSADNLQKTNYTTIVDFPTTVNITNQDINVNQNAQLTLPLVFEDENPEDHPIHATSATASQGQATIEGDNLKIKAPSNYYGPYQLELQFGSTEGGLEKKVLNGNIAEDTRIDYTHRPNPGLNHYGSGDADGDNQLPLNQNDLNRLIAVANGSFTDDNDKRLRDRCDVNGDGYVNLADVDIERKRINGEIPHLPGDWDNEQRPEQEDWGKKMFAIDKTNSTAFPEGDCNQFTDQTYINFHGVSLTDIPKFQEVYNYDFTNNGRFNLPLEEVTLTFYGSDGKITGHAMNAFIFGNPSIYGNICPFEPQYDHLNVQPGEDYFDGTNTLFDLRGPPITLGNKIIDMEIYVSYSIKNKIPTLTYINTNLINPSGK